MKKHLFLTCLLLLSFGMLSSQDFEILEPEAIGFKNFYNYKGIDLMFFENNGHYFYSTPEIPSLDYYLIEVFFDDKFNVEKSIELLSIPNRDKLNSRKVYDVYYTFNKIGNYLSAMTFVSPNKDFYGISYVNETGEDYIFEVDVFKDEKKIKSYQFDLYEYLDCKFYDISINNEGDVYFLGEYNKDKIKEWALYQIEEDGLKKMTSLSNIGEDLYDLSLFVNAENDICLLGLQFTGDKKTGFFYNYYFGKYKNGEFDGAINKCSNCSKGAISNLTLSPTGNIVFSINGSYSIDYINSNYLDQVVGVNIPLIYIDNNGKIIFESKIERRMGGAVGDDYRLFSNESEFLLFYNDSPGKIKEGYIASISYDGKIKYSLPILKDNSKGLFILPSFCEYLNKSIFKLNFFTKAPHNVKILEIK